MPTDRPATNRENKAERLMNLLILLLVSRQFLPKDRIRDSLEAYRGLGEDAFEKKFERDKEELRSLGVPIEMGSFDAFFDDEVGYRIKRDAFELPRIDFTADEAAVIGLAARVWQHAGLADTTSQALLKLTAGGVETDREALDVAQPALHADEPAFDALFAATTEHRPVRFDYRRGDSPEAARRHLQPWGVIQAHGRWYVVGHDVDRGEPRMFRLSRIQGPVEVVARGPGFDVPPGTDVRALARSLDRSAGPTATARLRARTGAAADLRRRASAVVPEHEGWDVLELDYSDADSLAADALAHLDAVVVLEPADVRERVERRLRDLVTGSAR